MSSTGRRRWRHRTRSRSWWSDLGGQWGRELGGKRLVHQRRPTPNQCCGCRSGTRAADKGLVAHTFQPMPPRPPDAGEVQALLQLRPGHDFVTACRHFVGLPAAQQDEVPSHPQHLLHGEPLQFYLPDRGPRKPVAGLSGPRDWAADAGESVPLTPTSTKIGSVGKAGWKLASTRTQFSNARTPAPQLQPRSCPYAASR
jgi:hypothetical protein